MRNLYLVLGVSKGATIKEIKDAYREQALSAHPDKGGSSDRMQLLNEAYRTLVDSQERREYEEKWEAFEEEPLSVVEIAGAIELLDEDIGGR